MNYNTNKNEPDITYATPPMILKTGSIYQEYLTEIP